MHETAIIVMLSIAFVGGILLTSGLLMMLFNGVNLDTSQRAAPTCCLTIQLILLTVTFFLINSQRSALADRY